MEKERNSSFFEAYRIICQTRRQCYGIGMHGCQWDQGTVFIDDVTANTNSTMNSEVYRTTLSSQIKPNTTKKIRWRYTVQINTDLKHNIKATKEFL